MAKNSPGVSQQTPESAPCSAPTSPNVEPRVEPAVRNSIALKVRSLTFFEGGDDVTGSGFGPL